MSGKYLREQNTAHLAVVISGITLQFLAMKSTIFEMVFILWHFCPVEQKTWNDYQIYLITILFRWKSIEFYIAEPSYPIIIICGWYNNIGFLITSALWTFPIYMLYFDFNFYSAGKNVLLRGLLIVTHLYALEQMKKLVLLLMSVVFFPANPNKGYSIYEKKTSNNYADAFNIRLQEIELNHLEHRFWYCLK